ncbi:MAG: PAS domain-containing protein, partial [Deltaproteobacteria bacterium]|nr:PAS domain-containing protein [Deltaproteobacteria bacterium]
MDNNPTHEKLAHKVAVLEERINTLLLTEKQLQEDLERHRTIANFTYDWEYWISQNREYIYVSPSCERVTGYSPDQLRHHPGLMEEMTHPDDREMLSGHITREMETQGILSFVF